MSALRMGRLGVATAFLAAIALWGAEPRAFAGDKKGAAKGGEALSPKAGGDRVLEGKTADGLVFAWRGPKRYDPEAGVGVTILLHGSGGDHRWGFANHKFETFRPDDLVLVPDGTSPNGSSFLFLPDPKDGKRLHALIGEAKKAFKVRGVYLYGHSQGSFYAFHYAGEYPDDVDGVVGHASGIWAQSKTDADGHRQALVVMHGTQDPVVPYFQSEFSYKRLRDAGYPMVRMVPLEGWNHWPAEHNAAGGTTHTSLQLAWVEGMTTKDARRLEACLDVLADVKDKTEHDWAGLWSLATHAQSAAFAGEATRTRAKKAAAVVEALAKRHAEALDDVKPGSPADGKPWMAHLPLFLRQFAGVPAREELAAKWKTVVEEHEKRGAAHFEKWWDKKGREKDVPEAFDEGIATIAEGFLWCRAQDRVVDGQGWSGVQVVLRGWHRDAKKHKLSKKALKDFEVVEMLEAAWKKGWEAYAEVCRTAGEP
jgi:predicted esterase